MGCDKCHDCGCRPYVTRQIRIGTQEEGGGGYVGDLDEVAKIGNETELRLIAAPAIFDNELATLGQIKDYSSGGGFAYIDANNLNHIEIPDGVMYKSTISTDITVGGLTSDPGTKGYLIIVQDDVGGHLVTLANSNLGTNLLNTYPRAITLATFIRTDTNIYWEFKILFGGIEPTTLPIIRLDDFLDTIEVFHSLPNSEILMSVNNGPWIEYPGPMSIGAFDRPEGYWRFKIKEGVNRLESDISYSLQAYANKKGFTYTLPAVLS